MSVEHQYTFTLHTNHELTKEELRALSLTLDAKLESFGCLAVITVNVNPEKQEVVQADYENEGW